MIPETLPETPRPTASLPRRMWQCFWRQSSRSLVCPEGPRLDGRTALVTGGSRGIGLETSRGLARRGATLISASRDQPQGEAVAEGLRVGFGVSAHSVRLDLADLACLDESLDAIGKALDGRPLDILVANAGLWPTRFAHSKQGHEIAFATNVLGHHALILGLIERALLADAARGVIVTGDIYLMATECSSDHRYRGVMGGQLAYCRSKLGNLWQARELARRRPRLSVWAVHPGVVASELSGSNRGVAGWVKRRMMLSPEQGAQASLFCATQPELEGGGYVHNTLGRVTPREDDPGADDDRARALWDVLESLRERGDRVVA